VGHAHYPGKVSDREEVVIEGKKILNAAGEQLGWLPKEVSPLLAPILTGRLRGAKVEAVVPKGSKNVYKIPLDLQVYGLACDVHVIEAALEELKGAKCEWAGLTVIHPVKGGIHVPELAEQLEKTKDSKLLNLQQLIGDRSKKRKKLSDEVQLFEPPVPYKDMLAAEAPVGLKADLYEHQKKALHWMMKREEPLTAADAIRSKAPCLWEQEMGKDGQFTYRNRITNTSSRVPPKLQQGGVLADDMGMGKTVTMASLLLAKRRTTLVVCPLAVLHIWEEQLRQFAPSLTTFVFHGQGKDRIKNDTYDVVLTTYRTLEQSKIETHWGRVILDEAHEIRNSCTRQAKACAALHTEIRWCVTGTPLLNNLKDIFGLLCFLHVEPFNDYQWWRRMIARPAMLGDGRGSTRLCQLLGTLLLRRTKDLKVPRSDGSLRPVLELPERRAIVQRVPLSASERALYDEFYAFALKQIGDDTRDGNEQLEKTCSNALCVLTYLRQLCCAAELLPAPVLRGLTSHDMTILEKDLTKMGDTQRRLLLRQLAEAPGEECSVCLEPLLSQQPCATPCAHLFHKDCLHDWFRSQDRCPLCNTVCALDSVIELPEEGFSIVEEALLNVNGETGPTAPESSKLQWCGVFVAERAAHGKVVVFSQFVRLLDRLAVRLSAKSVTFVRLQGNMTPGKRAEAINTFQANQDVRVILCSTHAAGVGVTLTAGNTVVLLDPWWNKAVEEQAIDRVHRIGQSKKVDVVRVVAENTVEEQILAVQDLKRGIFEAALSSDGKQRRMDVIFNIFRGPVKTKGAETPAKKTKKEKTAAGEVTEKSARSDVKRRRLV